MRRWLSITWAYVVEFILCVLVFVGIALVWDRTAVTRFIHDTAASWVELTVTLFAASLAVWLTFVNIRATEFGDYLDQRESVGVYSTALIASMIVHFTSTVLMILNVGIQNAVVAGAGLFFLIYGVVNLLTLVRNSTGLIRLYSTFRRELRKLNQQERPK